MDPLLTEVLRDRLLMPVLFSIIYLLFLKNSKKIQNFLVERAINVLQAEYFKELIYGLRLEKKNLFWTFIFPAVLGSVLELPNLFIMRPFRLPKNEPWWILFISSDLLSPIAEEFLWRGLLFGAFLAFIEALEKQGARLKSIKPGIATLMLFFQAFFFGAWHENVNSANLLLRTISGLLYGALYLLYGRNLLPAISAHISQNLTVTISAVVYNLMHR